MIIGLYQCPSPKGDLDVGFATIESALEAAAASSVDMLVMPEAFLPGYGATTSMPEEGWGNLESRLSEMCHRHSTALTIGLPNYEDDQVFNTAISFDDRGEILARYRKIQLFGPTETALYAPGQNYVVFDYQGKRFGLLICYDVEFPEHVRALVRLGAEVILVPTANMMPFVNVNQFIVPSRAAENAVSIAYANYCGTEGALAYTGLSAIFGPDGYPLASKGTSTGLCIAKLPSGWSEHDSPLSTQTADFREAT